MSHNKSCQKKGSSYGKRSVYMPPGCRGLRHSSSYASSRYYSRGSYVEEDSEDSRQLRRSSSAKERSFEGDKEFNGQEFLKELVSQLVDSLGVTESSSRSFDGAASAEVPSEPVVQKISSGFTLYKINEFSIDYAPSVGGKPIPFGITFENIHDYTGFDISNDVYTKAIVPEDGVYSINAQITVKADRTTTSPLQLNLNLRRDGIRAIVASHVNRNLSGEQVSMPINIHSRLKKGDELFLAVDISGTDPYKLIFMKQTESASGGISSVNTNSTYFSAVKVSN